MKFAHGMEKYPYGIPKSMQNILTNHMFCIQYKVTMICFPWQGSNYSPGWVIFLHNRSWISPWIKSISNELDITCHVFASQLSGHCDVIANQLWRHQQNIRRASEPPGWCVKILLLASFMGSLCRVNNKIMYVLLWRTVYAPTWALFWCLFPSLLRNSGNKHQNNPLVSA